MTTEIASEPTVDLAEARSYCTHAAAKIRDIEKAKAVIEASYKDQIAEINAWKRQEIDRYDGEIERLTLKMRPLVTALIEADPMGWRPDKPKGKRSVEFPAARAGFREGRESVKVEDAGLACSWLRRHGRDYAVRTIEEVDIPMVKADPGLTIKGGRFQTKDGECVPGLLVETGEVAYYVKPIGVRGDD